MPLALALPERREPAAELLLRDLALRLLLLELVDGALEQVANSGADELARATLHVLLNGEEPEVCLGALLPHEAPALDVVRQLHAEVLRLHGLREDHGDHHLVRRDAVRLAAPVPRASVQPAAQELHAAVVARLPEVDPRGRHHLVSRGRHCGRRAARRAGGATKERTELRGCRAKMAPVARRCITCPPAASLPKGFNPPAVDLHKLTHALTDATKVNLEPWTSHACATPNFTLYTLQPLLLHSGGLLTYS